MLVIAAFAALLAGCGGSSSSHPASKPPGAKAAAPEQRASDFVGIYSDDVWFGDAAYRRETLARQRAAGVELIRQPFSQGDFARDPHRFDDFVGAAADAGIRVLPVLVGPQSDGGMKPPSDPARFAGFAALMVQRYGPNGTFWN